MRERRPVKGAGGGLRDIEREPSADRNEEEEGSGENMERRLVLEGLNAIWDTPFALGKVQQHVGWFAYQCCMYISLQ